MNLLDLYENREPHQQAIDRLERARIDHLKEKMDYYAEHKMAKEFMAAKEELESYFKIKAECMGYGGLAGESKEMDEWRDSAPGHDASQTGLRPVGFKKGLVDEAEKNQDISDKRWLKTAGKKPGAVSKAVDTVKQAGKWLAGKGGPGKEGPTYEGQGQKKNSEITDPAQDRLLTRARREHPKAHSDAAALAMRILDKEQDDVQRLDHVNDREDKMIDRLSNLETNLQKQMDQLKGRQEVTEDQRLHVGDPVIVTAPNDFEGKTGEITEFSPSGKFVIVNLYNYGEHSMHLSDVKYNQYADDEEDEIDEHIVKHGSQYRLLSHKGKNLGTFPTHAAAAKHEGEVEYFKHKDDVEEGWSDAIVAQRTGRPRTPYSVYIKGKKWKDFKNDDHAEAVANKLRAKFKAEGRDPSVITIAPTDYDKGMEEAANPAQQAAIAIAMKRAGKKPKHMSETINLTESRTYKLWESAGRKIIEAQLTPAQIQQLFQQVEQGATASGGNRTVVGQGKDVAMAVNQAWEQLKTKVQNSGPIKNVDAAYDQAAAKLKQATGGDVGVMQYVEKYRAFAKAHPIAQSLIYSALIAAAGISGAGLGGAAALGLLKMTDKLLQGEKFSSAAYSGAKTGALAYGASLLKDLMSGTQGVTTSVDDPEWEKLRFQGDQVSVNQVVTTTNGNDTLKEVIQSIVGPNSKGEYLVRIVNNDDLREFVTKTPPPSVATNESVNRYIDRNLTVYTWALNESIGKPKGGVQLTNEGIGNMFKSAVSKAGQWAQTKGHNLTTRVTADKLQSAWQRAGSPTDSDAIAKILQSVGVQPEIVKQIYTSMKIPVSTQGQPTTAPATPAQAPVQGQPTTAPAKPVTTPAQAPVYKTNEDTGSWIVYDPETKQIRKRFKTHTAGKSYANTHGLGFASAEYYFDNIKQAVAEMDLSTLAQLGLAGAGAGAAAGVAYGKAKDWWDNRQDSKLTKKQIVDKLAKKQGVKETATDYSKRRQREKDIDAGRPVKPLPKNPQTDYARKRAKEKRDLELFGEGFMKEPANRKEYLDQRDKLFRMMSMDTNPANKQIIKQAIKDLDARYGSAKNPVNEESSTSSKAVEIAVIKRILVAHTDLIMQFGLDKVTQAIEEVAYGVGDLDEIGTSDVSAWVNEVKQILGVEA